MSDFNPNDIGNKNSNIFGFPSDVESAKIVFIPVPWDATVSYNAGTAKGPEAIFNASFQVDLYNPFKENAWEPIYAMCAVSEKIKEKNEVYKQFSEIVISHLANGYDIADSKEAQESLLLVNAGCADLNSWVKD